MNEKVMTLEEVRDDMASRLAEHRHPWLEEVAVWHSILDAAIREHQWLPIETAPRDGTEVLVYSDAAGTNVVHLARYRSEAEWNESGKYCGGWATLEEWEGWWSYTRNSVSQEKLDDWQTLTHWMPYKPPAGEPK